MPFDQFPANRPNEPQSPIDVALRPLPKSPVSSRSTRLGGTLILRYRSAAAFLHTQTRNGHSRYLNNRSSFRLINVPEYRRGWTVEYAGERFAPDARCEELPERDIDHLLIGFVLDGGSDVL